MSVQVVTVWAPRPGHPMWRDYVPLIKLQRDTALHFGHRHLVVTDATLSSDLQQLRVELPQAVMPAMIAGVIERLAHEGDDDLVFVDCDCLVNRSLDAAFTGEFDLGLTRRIHPLAPINNGAMYVPRSGIQRARPFFESALARCGTHWGADQEAISAEAAPVPDQEGVSERNGLRIGFLSMRSHNVVPKAEGALHRTYPFIVHFKGSTKPWARTYADKHIFPRETAWAQATG